MSPPEYIVTRNHAMTQAVSARRKVRRMENTNKKLVAFILLLPLIIWLVFFALLPLLYGFYLSFNSVRIQNLSAPVWNGLANYQRLLTDKVFLQSITWSVRFAIISVAIEMVLGMVLANVFNRNFFGKGVALTLLLLPMVVSPALMGTMFRLLFNEFVGPIAFLLSGITGTTAFLGMVWINRTIILADTINRTPMVFLNTYSALQGVSEELIEAAKIDGASWTQTTFKIVFPLILPILGVTFLERLLAAFLVFELVFALSSGGPGTFTQSVSIFIYRRAFERSDFGMANAASITIAFFLFFPAMYLVRRMIRSVR